MTRTRAMLVAALALAACGPGNTNDGRTPCASQTTCDKEFRKVCDSGFCSGELPSNPEHLENLGLQLTPAMELAGPKSVRAAVVFATTPDGRKVRCPDATPGANEVTVGDMAALSDPAKFNLSAPLLEVNLRSTGDVIESAVSVNGKGRLVYVELYSRTLTTGDPSSGGTPIGYGCVENAPYADDPSQAAVNVELKGSR